ncbi:C1 family peptidase [Enterococcus sp.]|uniref:C1 family peptidase n=1 Tax=Enterococcus sp. TaxID=35783 RepID=UPI002FC7BBCD
MKNNKSPLIINHVFCSQTRQDFESNKKHKLAQLGVIRNGLVESAEDISAKKQFPFEFSVDLITATNPDQYKSGRCWLFAIINMMNQRIQEKYDITDFELSHNYLFFYDKLEKANFFYHNVLRTATLDLDSREVHFLLHEPQQDGGQWDMLVSLIEKYGIVPLYAMPETENSRHSADMNKYLNAKLRSDAQKIRGLVSKGATTNEIAEQLKIMLEEVYRLLAICLGTPPEKFDVQFRDKNNTLYTDLQITPKDFMTTYMNMDLKQYVPIINAPSDNKPFNKTFSIDMLGNIIEGQPIKYLNLSMEELKSLTIKQLLSGEMVWFGSDIGQYTDRSLGIMSTDIYNVDNLFDIDFSSTKKNRLAYCQSILTHAMVICGVNIVKEKSAIWKIQNSWGKEIGFDGFFMMTDKWMDEYVYQVVINKKHLTNELLELYEENPIVLPPWDPMGSLA